MQVAIDDIKVKKRVRKEMGDIAGLADSMKRLGQISPILLSKQNELIAGGRRLAAAKSLGWKNINAVIIDAPQKVTRLEYEIEENLYRRDLNSNEISAAKDALQKMKSPGFFRRLFAAISEFFKRLFHIG
ncbi:MAG: ParB N-terminal domain-containing protein [Spirochaetaceae bacterium]|jgi:ParB family chromosome partitioning protein|nr:ParB N-terminal domain-containing protein [Spirochaetaceae bacterium]